MPLFWSIPAVWEKFEAVLKQFCLTAIYNKSGQLRNLIWPQATWAFFVAASNWTFLKYQTNLKKANKRSQEVLTRGQRLFREIFWVQIIPTDFSTHIEVSVQESHLFCFVNMWKLEFNLLKISCLEGRGRPDWIKAHKFEIITAAGDKTNFIHPLLICFASKCEAPTIQSGTLQMQILNWQQEEKRQRGLSSHRYWEQRI